MLEIIQFLLPACVFTTVFALGLKATLKDVGYLLHKPRLLARSILAMYVVTPAIAIVLVYLFKAPFPIEMAVLLMTISAGAPSLPKKLLGLGVDPSYIYSLSVIMAILAVFTVPASLAVISAIFPGEASLPPIEVAEKIAIKFLLPLLLGMLARRFLPSLSERFHEPLVSIAGILLLCVVALVIISSFSEIVGFGPMAFLLIITVTLVSLTVGHLFGGPDSNDRTALALACATRFPALGILVASFNFPGVKPVPIVIAYILTSSLTAIPYKAWRGKVSKQ